MAEVIVAVEVEKTLHSTVYLRIDEARLRKSMRFEGGLILPPDAVEFVKLEAEDLDHDDWGGTGIDVFRSTHIADPKEYAGVYVADATQLQPLPPADQAVTP